MKCCATDTKIIGSTLIHALYSTLCLIIIFSSYKQRNIKKIVFLIFILVYIIKYINYIFSGWKNKWDKIMVYSMNSVLIINETFTNGYRVEILDIISTISIISGIFVIISKNPIVSVLFLIGLFLSISSYLIILGINFIGLSYLLVYVGAVSILFLFILMLINVRISELLSNTSNSIPLAVLITIAFNFPVYRVLPYSVANFNGYTIDLNNTLNNIFYNNYIDLFNKVSYLNYNNTNEIDNNKILFVTSKIWDGNLAETSHITTIGNIMYTSYSIWLILTSIILLLAMVGAIVITIKQKNI